VVDRPFLTELLVVLLIATFVWPVSGYSPAAKPCTSINRPSEVLGTAQTEVSARTHACQPVPEGHPSKFRGVLDDDQAILCDDSEDLLESTAGFSLPYPAVLAFGPFRLASQTIGLTSSLSHTHTAPIHFLCSYQC
jgi:hypothetical protein